MEQRLSQLRGGGPVSGMMTTLAMLGEGIEAGAGQSIIEALSYRDDTDRSARAGAELSMSSTAFDRSRASAALAVNIQSTNPRDSKFEGRLQFKSPGA